MRLGTWLGIAGLLLVGPAAWSQELEFRAVAPRSIAPAPATPLDDAVTIGRIRGASQPAAPVAPAPIVQTTATTCVFPQFPIIRGQAPDYPPPPPFPGTQPPPPPPGALPPPGAGPVGGKIRPNEEAYNCGRINDDADQGSFFDRVGDGFRRTWTDVTEGVRGGFTGDTGRAAFQTPHCFDYILSPVTNPSYFEDPRALTEFRPVFMWESTPNSNPVFGGRDQFILNLQGRVALTDHISLVVQRFGWYFTDVANPQAGIMSADTFSEVHIGPKFSFGDDTLKRVWAFGLTFELPVGGGAAGQGTGDLGIRPYFSFAQNFGEFYGGSFNFLNTTGYDLPTDSQRTNMFFSSFHLDYDIGGQKKWYVLTEFNWSYYPFNGGARPFSFEGNNLYNFGSEQVGGRNDMTLAIGGRYKYSENLQFGIAAEFNVLGSSANHMDDFRLTLDMILRY